jgi:O-antigen/teichoic acid export membrane protein
VKPLDISLPSPDSAPGLSTPRAESGTEARPLPLRVNFSWTLIGNLVYAGCQWAMLVVLARLGRAEMVGQFALGLALTAPVLMCANLNLRSLQATDARREYSFHDYLGLRLASSAVAFPIIAGVALVSGYRNETLAVILLLGIAKGFEAISDIYYGLLQQNERMRPIAISMMIKGTLSLAALAAGLYFTGSLVWATALLGAVWASVFFGYDLPTGRALRGSRTAQPLSQRSTYVVMARLALLSAPMGMVMFLISLNSNIPRYFIERQLGLHELGIFAALSYLITASGTIVGALGQSATPRLSHFYATANRDAFTGLLWKLALVATGIGIIGVLIAAIAGGPALRVLYGAEYSRYGTLLIYLMTVSWLADLGAMLGYGMSAARRFRVQAPLYGAVALATFLSCWLLIPRLGLLGGALAMGIGILVLLVAGGAILTKAVRHLSQNSVTHNSAEGSA